MRRVRGCGPHAELGFPTRIGGGRPGMVLQFVIGSGVLVEQTIGNTSQMLIVGVGVGCGLGV